MEKRNSILAIVAGLALVTLAACNDGSPSSSCGDAAAAAGICTPTRTPTPTPTPGTTACTPTVAPIAIQLVAGTTDVWEFWIPRADGAVDVTTTWELFVDNVSTGAAVGGKKTLRVVGTGPHTAYGRGLCVLTPTIVF